MSWNVGQQLSIAPDTSTENPDRIDITDLAQPVLSELQKQALAWAEANPVVLEEEALLETARQATGLSNFGDPGFRKHMAKWIEATNAKTQLTALGRAGVYGSMLRNLTVRLQVEDMVQRFPEILDIPIGTVMSRLHRGRKALQKALYEFAAERGLAPEEPATSG